MMHLSSQEVRQSDQDITLFKSVGNAVQDVSVAHAVYLAAQKRGLGERVSFNPASARL
jgi:ornithine cyclodeaminase/alanine dehydrogenase-like protein (mu-crystallin family)